MSTSDQTMPPRGDAEWHLHDGKPILRWGCGCELDPDDLRARGVTTWSARCLAHAPAVLTPREPSAA